jgi:hypothetical protein
MNQHHHHDHRFGRDLSPEDARFARVAWRARRRGRFTPTLEELEAYQRDLEQEVADAAELIRRRKAADADAPAAS